MTKAIHHTRLLISLGGAHALNHSLFLVLPILLKEIILSTESSIETVAAVATVGYFTYGVGSLLGGALADRVGEGKILRWATALSGASTLIIFILPNIMGLGLGFFVMAVWASFYHPAANSFISKEFQDDLGSAMGIHGAAGSVGQIFAPSAAAVIGLALGWQYAFLFFGVLAIFASLSFGRLSDRPGQTGFSAKGMIKILKTEALWRLFAFYVVGGLLFRGVEFITPIFLTEKSGFTIHSAALAWTGVLAFGVIGQLVGGKPSIRIGAKNMLVITSIGVFGALLLLAFYAETFSGVVLFVVLYGICEYATQPAGNILTTYLTDEDIRGGVFGVLFFMTFGLGALSVAAIGYLTQLYGSTSAIYMMTTLAALATIIAALLPITHDGRSKSRLLK